NVTGHALDGKIFVDTADDVVVGLQYYLVIGGVGNRAAGCQRGGPRPAPGAQHLMNGVAMNKRTAPAAAGGKTISQHLHGGGEIRACQIAKWPGAAKGPIQAVFGPIPCRDFSHDLLRQYVERLMRDRDAVEFAAADAVE